nr:radical SAM protein [Euzebyales bacterium]
MDPNALGWDGLAGLLAGEPRYRAEQVRRWLVRGVEDPAQMTDLPMALRQRLVDRMPAPPRILRHSTADDGLTHKVLLEGAAGGREVESVLMLYPSGGHRAHARATVCVSTQAGCAMGCPFCATGQAGFRGQLSLGEVVRQVTVMQRLLATGAITSTKPIPDHVTNVVFMGMGEPLANLDVTLAAVRWLCARDAGQRGRRSSAEARSGPDGSGGGFGLSARSVTVSTVGLVPGIRRLAELGLPVTLAVSLHAPTDELRDDLVPVNRT